MSVYDELNVLFFDLETTGLDFNTDEITTIAAYMQVIGKPGVSYLEIGASQLFYLIEKSDCIVGHNIKFDLKFLLKSKPDFNLDDKIIIDTMVLTNFFDTDQSLKLGDVEINLFGESSKQNFIDAYGKDFSRYPKKILQEYNFNDVRVTKKIFDHLIDEIDFDFVNFTSDYLKSLLSIECGGIKFDSDKATKMLADISAQAVAKKAEIDTYLLSVSLTQINLNSSQQLSKLLYTDLQLPKPQRFQYPKGKAYDGLFTSTLTNKKLLEGLSHPFVELYLQYKTLETASTHLKSYIKAAHEGKIYSSFNMTSTVTGRLSSSNPNLQNIAKNPVEGLSVRGCFAADAGCTLVGMDFKQQEIVVLGALSNDYNLLRLIGEGKDLHSLVGEMMFGREITKDERGKIKALHFGLLYGLGIDSLSYSLGMNMEEAQIFVSKYYSLFPTVQQWMSQVVSEAKFNGFIEYFSGRRWYCKFPSDAYKAVNAIIQGSSADVTAIAVMRLHRYLKDTGYGRIVSIIHDEILCSMSKFNHDIENQMLDIMSVKDLFGLAFRVDLEVGY